MSWDLPKSRGISLAHPNFIQKSSILEKFFYNSPAITTSVSNPSIVTLSSDESRNKTAVLSPSLLLDDETQIEIYENYLKDNNLQPTDLSPMILRLILTLLDTITNEGEVFVFALKFYLNNLRPSPIPATFNERAVKNPTYIHKLSKYSLEERCILHTMYVQRIDKMILSAFEENKEDKANEILSLVALSHVIMNISEDDMKALNFMLTKFLVHFHLVNEEQLAPYIYFVQSRWSRLSQAMNYHKNKKQYKEQILDGLTDSLARENYRQLKKWNAIVANLTKSLEKPLIDLDTYIEKKKEEEKKCDAPEVDKCALINLLKKGYKYKELTNDKKLKSKRLLAPQVHRGML